MRDGKMRRNERKRGRREGEMEFSKPGRKDKRR